MSYLIFIIASSILWPPKAGTWDSQLICKTTDSYTIEHRYELLPEESFDESTLRRHFQYFISSGKGELFVVATSEPTLYEELSNPQVGWTSMHGPGVISIDSEAPMAYFFRISNHAFFQYRNAEGMVEWVILKGSNVLETPIVSAQLEFLGHSIRRHAGKETCAPHRRSIGFAGPRMELSLVKEILRFYDVLYSSPGSLDISIFEDVHSAIGERTYRYPSLRWTGLAQMRKEGGSRVYTPESGRLVMFSRDQFGKRRVVVYDGAKLVSSEDVSW